MSPFSPNRSTVAGPPSHAESESVQLAAPTKPAQPTRRGLRILVVWGNWGPYHHARFRSLHAEGQRHEIEVHGLELFPTSGVYDWEITVNHPAVHHLKVGKNETEFKPFQLAWKVLPLLAKLRCDVVFVPSYWHWSLCTNMAARACGGRIVMMNESHAGTEMATGWKKWIKRRIVRTFHAGLVGGTPHIEHFAALGLDPSVIFSGYDAVDNSYFQHRSEECRRNAATIRARLHLPEEYFLSLGRMVPKKNLATLVQSYAFFLQQNPASRHHLVFVGSGEEEDGLRDLALSLDLTVVNHTEPDAPWKKRQVDPAVHFYGFRQIEENPSLYALATAFVLPSLKEEWGLVVNEAMACGLPVLVSNRAGCAANLVVSGHNGYTFNPESVEELTTALSRVSASAERVEMGRHSREIVRAWGCEHFAAGALRAAAAANPRFPRPTPVVSP